MQDRTTMTSTSILTGDYPNSVQEDEAGYRDISALAVVGLLCGALSVLALDHLALLLVAVLALCINGAALRRIGIYKQKGRLMALAGMALALIFGLSAPALSVARERADRAQAIELARQWFEALRDDHPEAAYRYSMARWRRDSPDNSLPALRKSELVALYRQQPAVRDLLKLGKASRIRYCGIVSSQTTDESRTIIDLYSVAADRADDKTSFFVQLTITNRLDTMRKTWGWEVTQSQLLTQAPSLSGM